MKAYGISGSEIEFFNSYIKNRVKYCNINGSPSGFRTVSCGVPQSSIIGPLLFVIYMNNLPNAVENVGIPMFADDTSLFTAF